MNVELALALVDRVCGMAALNREDHIKVAQAIELLKQALQQQQPSDKNES